MLLEKQVNTFWLNTKYLLLQTFLFIGKGTKWPNYFCVCVLFSAFQPTISHMAAILSFNLQGKKTFQIIHEIINNCNDSETASVV